MAGKKGDYEASKRLLYFHVAHDGLPGLVSWIVWASNDS
jgi:hypothetical protein